MPGSQYYVWSFIGALAGSIISAVLTPIVINLSVDKTIKKLIHGPQTEDSFVSYLYQYENMPVTLFADTVRRSATGVALVKPVENLRQTNDFDLLHFNPVKTVDQICQEKSEVDTSVLIGANCRHPLPLQTPILMALPLAKFSFSAVVRQAIVDAARKNDTALLIKRDLYTEKELRSSGKLILQLEVGEACEGISSFEKQIAMVELTLPEHAPGNMGTTESQCGHEIKLWQHKITESSNLYQSINEIKKRFDGIPVAVRIRTSNALERNLECVMKAGADAVVLEGIEHGGLHIPSVVESGFGLSLPHSLVRAKHFLTQRDSKMDLIAQGRFWDANDCAKAIALGASGVIMDSVLLCGLLGEQITKALPFFPLESLLMEGSKRAKKLDMPQASSSLCNLLEAFRQELMIIAHAIGKDRLMNIAPTDLYTLDVSMTDSLNKYHG